jgi:hypothetical protein
MNSSLFPKDLFEFPYKWETVRQAPQKLLEAVGGELEKKSAGVLSFEIKRRVQGDIFLDFYITAPSLDDYHALLCTAKYAVSGMGYPVTLCRWDGKQVCPHMDLSEYDLLRDATKEFLAHEDTKNMAACLYFHAKHLENYD